MILSRRNWDYNNHCRVEFGDYVQASQVNYTNNTNSPRTLDGIYLCPAPNLQLKHHMMYLWMGQLITITKLVMVSITYVVINTVEKNVEYKRFNSLKYYDRKKEEIIFLDVDLAGVDHK